MNILLRGLFGQTCYRRSGRAVNHLEFAVLAFAEN